MKGYRGKKKEAREKDVIREDVILHSHQILQLSGFIMTAGLVEVPS